jgi:hypothetical protein
MSFISMGNYLAGPLSRRALLKFRVDVAGSRTAPAGAAEPALGRGALDHPPEPTG